MTILGVLFAWAFFVTFCDAVCKTIPLETFSALKIEGCRDEENRYHDFHALWIRDCEKCECIPFFGIKCCSLVLKPVKYNTQKCREIFRRELCRFEVVEKANPSVFCEVKRYAKL